uniref:Nuclear pore complex protein Nup155 n=4 Tax=Cacopsylla melanoneura TaxID=428564 RepID=A0A8D8PSS0_9HEMI
MYSISNSDLSIRNQSMDCSRVQMEALETAGKMLEKHMVLDSNYASLYDKMRIRFNKNCPTVSGLSEHDYPQGAAFTNIKQLVPINKVPIPPEIIENFSLIQSHSLMGLFPEINRAWLAVDNQIYIWDYEHRTDISYFDGLNNTIIGVGLVKPKPNIFKSNVKYLLVLSTISEVVILGMMVPEQNTVSISSGPINEGQEEIQLVKRVLYSILTDGVTMSTIKGSSTGRIFLGGTDGNLYEIEYQRDATWFSKACRKVNLTQSSLSYILPTFVNALITREDSIVQIAIDNSRHVLYTRSEVGTITVYNLCEGGQGFRCVVSISEEMIVKQAVKIQKTLENTYFKTIVSISAIEARECLLLGLVVTCESGTRLYFNPGFTLKNQRPTYLNLVHVRLPPGFTGAVPLARPDKVNLVHYSRGNLVMNTAPLGIQESIWLLSSDSYPFQPSFMESQTCLIMDSKPWVLEEVGGAAFSSTSLCTKEEPPLVVRQHYERLAKYVALGPHGVEIYSKLRPVDLLAQLLKDGNGPNSQSVKQYFHAQSEDQACASCLILACNSSTQNLTISEWATRAFFLYGGEPKPAPSSLQDTSPFSPNMISTPQPGSTFMTSQQPQTDAIFSAKHNGLYLYVSRILRPVWTRRVVKEVAMGELDTAVTLAEISIVCSHLHAVSCFIENHSNILPPSNNVNVTVMKDVTVMNDKTLYETKLQEVYLMERRSLEALKMFIGHACQVLGFWRILCEHHFPNIASFLTDEQKSHLLSMTFQQLISTPGNQDVCSVLMNHLLNYYLVDNTPVHSVTLKLREVCPKIFRNEDATCAKANELVMYAKKKISKEDKEQYLRNSVKLYKEVIPRINLKEVCRQYATCQFYDGIVSICIDFARKIDPSDTASRYYYNQSMDSASYVQRLECYNEIINVLEQLYNSGQSGNTAAVNIPRSPGYCELPIAETQIPSKLEAKAHIDHIIAQCLASADTLLHASVYDWMITKGLTYELIESSKPSLEKYLVRCQNMSQFSLDHNGLLWKYHERHGNHAAAADILMKMARTPDNNVQLEERREFLAKALLCMRSQEAGVNGHYMHELDDLLQIAGVQRSILSAITDIANTTDNAELQTSAQHAILSLNNNLYGLTELFTQYAEEFELWECKLQIIEMAGYREDNLIQTTWQKILQVELDTCTADDPNIRVQVVMDKVASLYEKFETGSFVFPGDFLVYQLEYISCSLGASPELIQKYFINMGVSLKHVISIYEELCRRKTDVWGQCGDPCHLVTAIGFLAENFVRKHMEIAPPVRKQLAFKLQDLLTNCLSTLYSKTNVDQIVHWLREIQKEIGDICMQS